MRRLCFLVLCWGLLSIAAFGQTPDVGDSDISKPSVISSSPSAAPATCTCSTTIIASNGAPARGVKFFVQVNSTVVSGQLVQPAQYVATTDGAGVVRITVLQGASVTLSGEHPSYATPVTVSWPTTSTCNLSLYGNLSLATPPLFGGMTILGGTPSSFKAGTLNITGTGVTVTQSPDNQANIVITSGSGAVAWGSVTGTLSAQTDLQSALNAKQNTLTLGNLTSGTTGLTVTGGGSAIIGSGTSLTIQTATDSVPGLLSAADHTTFNAKQAALGFTPENAANKNISGGYAGVSAGGKITTSQIQEVLSVNDLTEYSGASGTGATALRSTITAVSNGQGLTWDAATSNWINTTLVSSVAFSTDSPWMTVGSSPLTGPGTITYNRTSGLPQNQVLATPDGGAGVVSLRSLVNNDLPIVNAAHGAIGGDNSAAANGKIPIGNGSGFTVANLTAGTNITITNGAGTVTIAASSAVAHEILSSTHTGTAVAPGVRGDLITEQGSGSPLWTRLALGAQYKTVQANATDVVYDAVHLDQAAAITGIGPAANGFTGVDASAAANGKVLIGNGSGFTLATLTAGSNVSITNNAGSISIAATVNAGQKWSQTVDPDADLSLAMSAFKSTFTWNNNTGTSDLLTLKDTTGNSSASGHILMVNSVGTSTAKPFAVCAQGTANCVEMGSDAILKPVNSGGITANALNGVSGNGIQVRTSAGNFTSRTDTAGAGISITNGDGVAGNPTVAVDLSTLVASQTLWDGSQSSRTITFNLSGTDPVLTLSSSAFNISTGTLQQGGTAVVLQTRTLTAGAGINTLGDLSSDRTVSVDQAFSPTWTGVHTFTPTLRSSGVAPYLKITTPADTGQTADTEFPGIVFGGNASHATVTRTGADGTTYAKQREYLFVNPTYNYAGSTTVTHAVTLSVPGAPVATGNATFTDASAVWIEGGNLAIGSPTSVSTNFWRDTSPTAQFLRLNGRALVGGAIANDGRVTNTTNDWAEVLIDGITSNAQVASLNVLGLQAVLGATRSSDYTGGVTAGTIGLLGFAVNDNTSFADSAYGGYFEAWYTATSIGAATHGVEIDIVNKGTAPTSQPFSVSPTGLSNALWLASGGSRSSVNDATLALGIINNGAKFKAGIVFGATAITGTDGVTGTGPAIKLAKGHQLLWYNSDGSTRATLGDDTFSFAGGGTLSNTLTISGSTSFFNALNLTSTNADANGGPYFLFDRDSASPAANDALGNMIWRGRNSAASLVNLAIIGSTYYDTTAGSEDAGIAIGSSVNGALNTTEATFYKGIQVGAPTGGAKGVGTANFAADIYKNNTAYSNPHGGFEYAYTGKVEKYADRMAAMGLPNYHPLTLSELENYTRENFHFPYLGDEERVGVFGGGERLLLITEELAVHLFRLAHRLEELEKRVAKQ